MAKRLLIKLDKDNFKVNIPGSVHRQAPFNFAPNDFGIGNETIKDKIISGESQTRGLEAFLKNPSHPWVYGVGSAPDDAHAKYFAAFLAQAYTRQVPNSRVVWHHVYGNFSNPLIENQEPASLLVLTGMAPNSTAARLEKCRDLLEFYSDIPRIVVTAGVDPVTFFYSVLHQKLTQVYYQSKNVIKRRVEVV